VKFSQWLTLIISLVCLYIFWQIRTILLLTLMAVVFAVILNRAVSFLQQRIHSRKNAIAIVFITVFISLGIVGTIIVPPFIQQLQELINLSPQVINRIQQWLINFEMNFVPDYLRDFEGLDILLNQLRNFDVEMVVGRFYRVFSNTLTVTLNLLLGLVVTVMLLINPPAYRRLFVKTFPSSLRQPVSKVLDDCEEAIAGWFIGISFNMLVIGVMSMVGLWILGVPLALANGLLAGLLAFIPNIGPALSVIPPAAIALLETPWKAIAVVVLYILIQQLESNVLTPYVMRKQVSLLPAVTLLSQVIFAVFFGFLGLLLALPLTLIIQQWLEEFWLNRFAEQH
jgi:predicted PurR-regulated permease PerM